MHAYSNLTMKAPKQYSSLSREAFEKICASSYEPFVIKNLAEHWPLVDKSKQDENAAFEHLQGIAANATMKLTRIPSDAKGRMFYSSDMQKMNFGTAQLPAAECFKRIAGSVDDADYAVQSAPVKHYFPALAPTLTNTLLDDSIEPLIWIGNHIVVAPHFDEFDNIAVVAVGKRRFTLFPPEQVANLYVGPLEHTPAGQPISLVDIKTPDLSTHPKYALAHAAGLSVQLEPGDAIYIPTPWWHHVESLSPFNVLINYWWSDKTASTSMPFPMLLHAIQSLNSMNKDQRIAWKAIMQHYLFDKQSTENESTSAHIPEAARGILGELTPELVKELDMYIKQRLL